MIKIGTALFEACEELERERGISKEVLIASLCDAMVAAYKKHMHIKEADNIEAILDEQSGEIGVFSTKLVVDEVEDPDTQITLADAKDIVEDVEVGDEIKIEVTPEQIGKVLSGELKLADGTPVVDITTLRSEINTKLESKVPKKDMGSK